MMKQQKTVVPTIAVTLDYTDGNQRRHSILPFDDREPLTDVEEIYPGDERKFSTVSSIHHGSHGSSDTDTYSLDGSEMEEDVEDSEKATDSGCETGQPAVTLLEAREGKAIGDFCSEKEKIDFTAYPLSPLMPSHGHGGLTDVEDVDIDSPLPPESYFETESEENVLLHASDPVEITSCKLNETCIDHSDEEVEEVDFTDEEDMDTLERPPLQEQPTVVCRDCSSDTDSEDVTDSDGSIIDEEDLKGRKSAKEMNKAMIHWTKLFNCMAIVEKWKRPTRYAKLDNEGTQEVDADEGPTNDNSHRLTSCWKSLVRQALKKHRRQSRASVDLGAETEVDEVDDADGEIVRDIAETWLKKVRKHDELAGDILVNMDCGLDMSSKMAETEIIAKQLAPEEPETDEESVAGSALSLEPEHNRPKTLKLQTSTDEEELDDPNAEIWHEIAAKKAEMQKMLNQAKLMVLPSPTDGVINLVVPGNGSRRPSNDSAISKDDPASETELLSDAEDENYFGHGWELADKSAGKRKLDHDQAMKCLQAVGAGCWNIQEGSTKMSNDKGDAEYLTDIEEFEGDFTIDFGPEGDDQVLTATPSEVVAISERAGCVLIAANEEPKRPAQMMFLSVDSRQNTELLTEEEDFGNGSDAEAYLRAGSDYEARAKTPDINFEHITVVQAKDNESVVHDKVHRRHHHHQAAANSEKEQSSSSSDEEDAPRSSNSHGKRSKNSLQVQRSLDAKLTDTEEILVNDEVERQTAPIRAQSMPESHSNHHRGPRRRRHHK